MQIPIFSKNKSEQTEGKMQITLRFKLNKPEFEKLTSNIYDNQNNKDFEITINKKAYEKKKKKKNWTKVTTSKTSKNEAKNCVKN